MVLGLIRTIYVWYSFTRQTRQHVVPNHLLLSNQVYQTIIDSFIVYHSWQHFNHFCQGLCKKKEISTAMD